MDMRFIKRTVAICAAAALLAPAAFAQDSDSGSGGSAAAPGITGLQRTADIVNLMRTVFDPNPAPVLVSPAERAVAGKTSTGSKAAVVKTVPVVIMPDIVIQESVADGPDKARANADANTDADDPPHPDVAVTARKDAAVADDSGLDDEYPELSYVFFFGEYVPYFRGWFYYADRWFWGKRGIIPPEPPGWIPPPPPPPPPRPFNPLDPLFPDIGPIIPGPVPGPRPGTVGPAPGRTNRAASSARNTGSPKEQKASIPVVPDQHRIPRRNGTSIEPAAGQNTTIPVVPDQHRFPSRTSRQDLFPSRNNSVPVSPDQHRIPRKSGL